jgi:hypothetical protein
MRAQPPIAMEISSTDFAPWVAEAFACSAFAR